MNNVDSLEKQHEIEVASAKMIEKLKAVFLLAGIDCKSFHKLPNEYCGDQCEVCRCQPWGLAETKHGLIKIGWRKRVINIEWPKEAEVHGKDVKSKEEAWVTDDETGVHAYGYAKAVEYLANFAELARKRIINREADARLAPDELKEFYELNKVLYGDEKLAITDPVRDQKLPRYEELQDKRHPRKVGTNLPSQK